MKITAILANHLKDFGAENAFNATTKILTELGEVVDKIDLTKISPTLYRGHQSQAGGLVDILTKIDDGQGIVFVTAAALASPSALGLALLEHFSAEGIQILKGKKCLILSISQDGTSRGAMEHFINVLAHLGAIDVVRVCLNTPINEDAMELMERQAEDFYRILRQNRKYPDISTAAIPKISSVSSSNSGSKMGSTSSSTIKPSGSPATSSAINIAAGNLEKQPAAQPAAHTAQLSEKFVTQHPDENPEIQPKKNVTPIKIEDLYKKHKLDNLSQTAQDDIDKITTIFAQKFVSNEDSNSLTKDEIVSISPPPDSPTSGPKTCKQLTASLPHHFNPQLARGFGAVIQMDISGEGGFSGYITIAEQKCDFNEGQAPKHDVAITTDAPCWINVLKKKTTAQKAFMMGKLKVRGNFMLLSKFDQLFNKLP